MPQCIPLNTAEADQDLRIQFLQQNIDPGRLSRRKGEITMKYYFTESVAVGVRAYLEYKHIRYDYVEEMGTFVFFIRRRNHPHSILRCRIVVNQHCFNFYAQFPQSADISDPKQIMQICRMFAVVNYNIPDGNYEHDIKDGEIRYRVHRYCPDDTVSFSMISSAIEIAEYMIDIYENAIIAVLFNLVSGTEIAEMIRKKTIQNEKAALNDAEKRSSHKTAETDMTEEVIKFVKRFLMKDQDKDDCDLSRLFSA
jgi:hypothetical protein